MTLVKKINHVLYKFIWNRHFLAAKAPERINRKIVNTPLKLGGLGMLDVNELDASLKIKSLGRLLETRHPFLGLIRNFLNLNCFFNPKCMTDLDPFTIKACNLLKKDRDLLWSSTPMQTYMAFLSVVRHSEIGDLLNPNGKTSIWILSYEGVV